MKRLPLSLGALCLALLTHTGSAQSAAPPPGPPELYKRAVANLDQGQWFESAITDLQEATRRDPKNSACHLALGCAEVDRAGSLAYAAYMMDQLLNDQARYPKTLADWEAAQQDPKSDNFGRPRPEAPPRLRFQTKDDLLTLRLSGKEAVARIGELGRAAQTEWARAVALAPTQGERAEAENVQGWGLRYERLLLETTSTPESKVLGAPRHGAVVAAFTAATQDAPNNAEYWEGLGDACNLSPYDDVHSYDDAVHWPDMQRAWEKSLALAPRNPGLRYRLFQQQAMSDKKAALETLGTLAADDPGNAWLQYHFAYLLFQQVHYADVNDRNIDYQTPEEAERKRLDIVRELAAGDGDASRAMAEEAIAALERGNGASELSPPEYVPPVPKMLRRAWNYWAGLDFDWSDMSRLREVARAAGGCAQVLAAEGREEEAVRAARAAVGAGQRLAEDWPLSNSPGGHEVMDALAGFAVVAIGEKSLGKVYALCGDDAGARQAQAEYDAFQQKVKAYKQALKQAMSDEHTYSNY